LFSSKLNSQKLEFNTPLNSLAVWHWIQNSSGTDDAKIVLSINNFTFLSLRRAVHKRRPPSGRHPVRTKETGFRCGCPQVLVQKLRIFWNLWCVRTEKGWGEGLNQCG